MLNNSIIKRNVKTITEIIILETTVGFLLYFMTCVEPI